MAAKEKNPFIIYYLTFVAVLGGFLFGYTTAIINPIQVVLPEEWKSNILVSSYVASLLAAAAIFALVAGPLMDAIGRKPVIMLSALVFTLGSIPMALANGPALLIVGRVIQGIAVGFISAANPVYISECAPANIRGMLVSSHQLFITIGILISNIVGGALQSLDVGWRIMAGIAAVPGVIQIICFLTLPESPRYLVKKGQLEKAEKCLKQIRKSEDVTEELEELKMSHASEGQAEGAGENVLKRIFTTPHVRKALFVGCMLQFFQQISAVNIIFYYSAFIFNSAGFPQEEGIWLAVIPSAINVLATFPGIWAVETLGRKLMLVISYLGLAVSLLVLVVGFGLLQFNSPEAVAKNESPAENSSCTSFMSCYYCNLEKNKQCGYCYLHDKPLDQLKGACVLLNVEDKTKEADKDIYAKYGRCKKGSDDLKNEKVELGSKICPTDTAWLTVIGLVMFVMAFAPGAGPMPWTVNAEIFPGWARGVANSMATATNWIVNTIVGFTFKYLLEWLYPYGTFILYTAFCVISAVFTIVMVPETKDKSLEEIQTLFMSKAARQQAILKEGPGSLQAHSPSQQAAQQPPPEEVADNKSESAASGPENKEPDTKGQETDESSV